VLTLIGVLDAEIDKDDASHDNKQNAEQHWDKTILVSG
jgi:hypothetical protein